MADPPKQRETHTFFGGRVQMLAAISTALSNQWDLPTFQADFLVPIKPQRPLIRCWETASAAIKQSEIQPWLQEAG